MSNTTSYVHNPLEGNKPELIINLNESVNEAISVIIVHKDRPEYLNICLQSIAVNSANNSYEIIVVDNNSGPTTQSFLQDIENDVKVVRNNKNLYWSAAINAGIKAANPNTKYFIFMHSDVVILNPSWMDLFVNVCESNNSGMVGLETSSYYINSQKIDFIQEWCLMMTRSAITKVGNWPEQLPMIGHSFIMTVKAQIHGLKPQIMKNNMAHHYRIFGMDVNDYEKMSEEAASLLPRIYQQAQSRTLV
jgi:GT2 family glycosyltransferase